MKKIGIAALLLLATLIPAGMPAQNKGAAQNTMSDEMLWAHLQRRSVVWYDHHVRSGGGTVEPGDWKTPIERAFLKLAGASGHGPASLSYCVVNNDTFNAGAFVGGQFVIHAGVLKVMEDAVQKALKGDGAAGQSMGINTYREAIIAPLLAHELAHFYNRHTFHTIKRIWNYAGKPDEIVTMEMMKHSREHEFDADMTGFIYLKKAGYAPSGMVDLLNYLNALNQDYLKRGGINISYFTSHPTPHERLAKIDGGNAAMHRWAAEMEKVFEDVQFGKNLGAAVASLDRSLQKYPGNIHLEKARAVALHKLWLSTVPLRQQVLKAVITSPTFRDDMVSGRASRGSGIPGNREFFNRARKAYEKTMPQALDPEFQSNYAVLICYSPVKEDIALSIQLAEDAAKKHSTVGTISNLAMVYYLNQKNDDAKRILTAVSGQIDQHYARLIGAAATDENTAQHVNALKSFFRQCQLIDKTYVPGDYTPILNLALVLVGTGDMKGAKALAADYFKKYDTNSLWSQYLSQATGVPLPAKPKSGNSYPVRGVKVGDSLDRVVKTWGKPTEIVQSEGEEFWLYGTLDSAIVMEGGFVRRINLGSSKSPKAGTVVGVGVAKAAIEKAIGAQSVQSGTFFIYGEGQDIAIEYVQGLASKVVVLR